MLHNGAYASGLFWHTANHKFTKAQVKLTRARALVGPGLDTTLHKAKNEVHFSSQILNEEIPYHNLRSLSTMVTVA